MRFHWIEDADDKLPGIFSRQNVTPNYEAFRVRCINFRFLKSSLLALFFSTLAKVPFDLHRGFQKQTWRTCHRQTTTLGKFQQSLCQEETPVNICYCNVFVQWRFPTHLSLDCVNVHYNVNTLIREVCTWVTHSLFVKKSKFCYHNVLSISYEIVT